MASGMESCSKPLVWPMTNTSFKWTCLARGAGGISGEAWAQARVSWVSERAASSPQETIRELRPSRKVSPLGQQANVNLTTATFERLNSNASDSPHAVLMPQPRSYVVGSYRRTLHVCRCSLVLLAG